MTHPATTRPLLLLLVLWDGGCPLKTSSSEKGMGDDVSEAISRKGRQNGFPRRRRKESVSHSWPHNI